jgi:hypothetical protein
MNPDAAAFAARLRLWRQREPTALSPTFRRCVDEYDIAFRLVNTIEAAIGIPNRPFSERVAFTPSEIACARVEANPTNFV